MTQMKAVREVASRRLLVFLLPFFNKALQALSVFKMIKLKCEAGKSNKL